MKMLNKAELFALNAAQAQRNQAQALLAQAEAALAEVLANVGADAPRTVELRDELPEILVDPPSLLDGELPRDAGDAPSSRDWEILEADVRRSIT